MQCREPSQQQTPDDYDTCVNERVQSGELLQIHSEGRLDASLLECTHEPSCIVKHCIEVDEGAVVALSVEEVAELGLS